MNIDELIESLGSKYDTDALEFDYQNNNFDIDTSEVADYYTPLIVANSIINGQFKQAVKQFKAYGLSCGDLDGFLEPKEIHFFDEF